MEFFICNRKTHRKENLGATGFELEISTCLTCLYQLDHQTIFLTSHIFSPRLFLKVIM